MPKIYVPIFIILNKVEFIMPSFSPANMPVAGLT